MDRNICKHGPFLCRALIVSNTDSQENQIDCLHIKFEAIRAIEFKYVNFTTLQSFFKQLPMQQLESIAIEIFDKQDGPIDMEQQIWSTIAIAGQNQLRHLRTSLQIIRCYTELLLSNLPSLQYVILKYISVEEMSTFVRHTPNLCSFTGRITEWDNDKSASDFTLLSKLTHLDLHIKGCNSFEKLRQLLSVCPYLTHLMLRFWITERNASMINATRWQTLIEQCLPRLIYLKIRLFRYIRTRNYPDFKDTFNQSEYWLRRRPQFDIQVR
jgi:hypothetical protein